ncbi:hypothetical protein V496_00661 [Pseudogymnoascus sp. VKM F-4515 (FW-2607)]|nr:hypothetical protein V496_00661 [Pseudogymnoascus sp. VKM F-4515 (FW-2607)]KFY97766.1 hypothetical protein V498_01889 [Pseudogymnoascus sp. VKM F-4517 (FW-2822)]
MASRTLSSGLRSRASFFKPRQSQPMSRVSCLGLGQTRSYAPNHDDPFDDDHDAAPPQHQQLNIKLRDLVNSVPLDRKIRFVKDNSEESHPTPDAGLLNAIFKPTTPLPYTVGTDICHIPRVLLVLERQLADPEYIEGSMPRFWTRVLHPIEARYNGWKSTGLVAHHAKFIAGRWAAKEAVIKAFSAAYPALDKIFMHDIVVLNANVQSAIAEARKAAARIADKEGGVVLPQGEGFAPEVPKGGAPRAFVRVPRKGLGWVEVSVSISHDGEYATAAALVPVDPKIAKIRKEKTVAREVIAKTYTDARYM